MRFLPLIFTAMFLAPASVYSKDTDLSFSCVGDREARFTVNNLVFMAADFNRGTYFKASVEMAGQRNHVELQNLISYADSTCFFYSADRRPLKIKCQSDRTPRAEVRELRFRMSELGRGTAHVVFYGGYTPIGATKGISLEGIVGERDGLCSAFP